MKLENNLILASAPLGARRAKTNWLKEKIKRGGWAETCWLMGHKVQEETSQKEQLDLGSLWWCQDLPCVCLWLVALLSWHPSQAGSLPVRAPGFHSFQLCSPAGRAPAEVLGLSLLGLIWVTSSSLSKLLL